MFMLASPARTTVHMYVVFPLAPSLCMRNRTRWFDPHSHSLVQTISLFLRKKFLPELSERSSVPSFRDEHNVPGRAHPTSSSDITVTAPDPGRGCSSSASRLLRWFTGAYISGPNKLEAREVSLDEQKCGAITHFRPLTSVQNSFIIMDTLDRVVGSLVGLACGDAVGTTSEFKERGSFPEVRGMVGGGVNRLKPGQWTDDTSLALCLAQV